MKALALAALLVLTAVPGFAQTPVPFPFEDVNNNGVFDAGDKNLAAKLKSGDGIYYTTAHSLVIPAGVSIRGKKDETIELVAGRNLTVHGDISTGSYGSITLWAEAGNITIGPRVRVNAPSQINLTAGQGVSLGAGVQLSSTGSSGNLGSVDVFARTTLTIGARVRVATSGGGMYLWSGGGTSADEGLALTTPLGTLLVLSESAIKVTKATIIADNVTVVGAPLALTHSRVRAPNGCYLGSNGAPAVTTGTVLPKGCAVE